MGSRSCLVRTWANTSEQSLKYRVYLQRHLHKYSPKIVTPAEMDSEAAIEAGPKGPVETCTEAPAEAKEQERAGLPRAIVEATAHSPVVVEARQSQVQVGSRQCRSRPVTVCFAMVYR